MRSFVHVLLLAFADFRHEKLLSFCAVFGLAAVLAPLLILYGVKFGVVQTLTDRMLSDPNTLEISPVASGNYTQERIDQMRQIPGVAFVLPSTRTIAATMALQARHADQTARAVVSLAPTAAGDPLLVRYGAPTVTMVPHSQPRQPAAAGQDTGTPAADAKSGDQAASVAQAGRKSLLAKRPEVDAPSLRESGAVLSDSAARKLGVAKGDMVLGIVERAYAGQISSAYVRLRVHAVLPLAAEQKDTAWVPLELVESCEDFRDGRCVPNLGEENGWSGEVRPDVPRPYASFRLYASDLHAVTRLHARFAKEGIETYTHAEEIEQILALERGLNLIFSLICLAACVGFFSSTTSSVLASVKRKERTLGLLQLMGFAKGTLFFFPLAQVLLVALAGTLLAIGAYALAAFALNSAFAGSLQGLEQVCLLLPVHFALAFAASVGISLLAALGPASHSVRIEPSEVIRDV